MLRTVEMAKSFWAEIVKTACYVINRSLSITIDLKTPKKMWNGKPVNYSCLYIFESPLYVMYNTQEISKLDLKYRKCIFFGYTDRVNGYHPWDLIAHKVIFNRDIIFIEYKV